MKKPRLRDSKYLESSIYPIDNIQDDIIIKIAGSIIYLIYTGRNDMTGDDWGNIFANAIEGEHLSSPLGIADVVKDKTAWSMKTVKNANPLIATNVRLISGRYSPDYSYGITDPHADIQKTGEAVLAIWNSRVDIALAHYNTVRIGVLVRSNDLQEFVYFEEYLEHFRLSQYIWKENPRGNLEGYDKYSGNKHFIWQPHGSQFTILCNIPDNGIKFRVKHPRPMTEKEVLDSLNFSSEWIEFIDNKSK